MPGTFHVVFAIATLIFGAIVTLLPKGDQRHRKLGYFYVISLLSVNVSALSVYEDSANFGPFHILALISLITLISGFIPAFFRRPVTSWLELHGYFMSWSYVGLVVAGVAQMFTMSSILPPWLAVGISTILLVLFGGVLIHTRVPKIVAAFASGGLQHNRHKND